MVFPFLPTVTSLAWLSDSSQSILKTDRSPAKHHLESRDPPMAKEPWQWAQDHGIHWSCLKPCHLEITGLLWWWMISSRQKLKFQQIDDTLWGWSYPWGCDTHPNPTPLERMHGFGNLEMEIGMTLLPIASRDSLWGFLLPVCNFRFCGSRGSDFQSGVLPRGSHSEFKVLAVTGHLDSSGQGKNRQKRELGVTDHWGSRVAAVSWCPGKCFCI